MRDAPGIGGTGGDRNAASRKRGNIARLAIGQVCVMGLWFSASAVVPQLREVWTLSPGAAAWLTMSVQLGFAVGALGSALLNVPDRIPLARLIATSSIVGVLANASIPFASCQSRSPPKPN